MIRYSDGEGIVRVNGLYYNEEKTNVKLPHVAIGVFSRYLYQDVVEKFPSREVGYISCANYRTNVYVVKYKDVEITFIISHSLVVQLPIGQHISKCHHRSNRFG